MPPIEPVLFYLDIDWSAPISEEEINDTSIFVGHNGAEQRRANRLIPNRRVSYLVQSMNSQDRALARALITGGQHLEWLVPMWMHARKATADISAVATTVNIDTVGTRFVEGNGVMFFQRPRTAVYRIVEAYDENSLDFDTALGIIWRKGKTQVVPLIRGLLSSDVEYNFSDIESAGFQVTFDLMVTEPTP